MQGKYSPTIISVAQEQFDTMYTYPGDTDAFGYDSYGYAADGFDRAGYKEEAYYSDDELYESVAAAFRNRNIFK